MDKSLSIVIPALNEEENISDVLNAVIAAFKPGNIRYEILVFDDGSSDNTYDIASGFAEKNMKIKVFKNDSTRGIGYCLKEGVKNSCCSYITYFPGDNQDYPEDRYRLALDILKADMIIAAPCYGNKDRSLFRKVLSKIVTRIFLSFINVKLSHVTNAMICSVDLMKNIKIKCSGFMSQVEVLLKGFRSCKTVMISDMRVNIRKRERGRSKAVSFKTLSELFYLFFILVISFYITDRKQYSSKPALIT